MIFQLSFASVINLNHMFAAVCAGVSASLFGWAIISILPLHAPVGVLPWLIGGALGFCYGFLLPVFSLHIFTYIHQIKTWQKLLFNGLLCGVLASLVFGLAEFNQTLTLGDFWKSIPFWPLLSLVLLIRYFQSWYQAAYRFISGVVLGLFMGWVNFQFLPLPADSFTLLLLYGLLLSLLNYWLDNLKTPHHVVVLEGPLMGFIFDLHKKTTTIGQAKDHINLSAYKDIHTEHAKIFKYQNNFWLQNNDPYQNSWLNFRNTDQNNTLKNGDIIQLGQAKLQFCSKI